MKNHYHRYHIETKKAANIIAHPHRFNVKVNKLGLAKLLLKEVLHYKGSKEVILSRPCVYGVFSGPLGGFAPREKLCVGCLRCTTEHPEFVQISPNPERRQLGDEYFTPDHVDTIIYEAETGRIPIKGAGYRGPFGGTGWDAMWTDMSEIVRPTRDGIHGREFISTEVDLGEKPSFLQFDDHWQQIGDPPRLLSIPIPFIFDQVPVSSTIQIFSEAAHQLQTFAIIPLKAIEHKTPQIVPLITSEEFEEFQKLGFEPLMLELADWDENIFKELCSQFPRTLVVMRAEFETDNLMSMYQAGVRFFHLTADYHGRGKGGKFILDLIRDAHAAFVRAGCRDSVTLIGSGGMIAAEHMAKAIICGLDAVALDTPLLVALQAQFVGNCSGRQNSRFRLPSKLPLGWGVQRLKNLAGAWHHQLLEILGAMGLREVRRMRGEMGRAMFQKVLEREAFTGISGYDPR